MTDPSGVGTSTGGTHAEARGVDLRTGHLALLLAGGLLADPLSLPVDAVLELAVINDAFDGASLAVHAGSGLTVIAGAGHTDTPIVTEAPIRLGTTTLASLRLHRRVRHVRPSDPDVARRLAGVIVDLLARQPRWGLDPSDPVGVFVADRDSRILSVTPSVGGILGHDPAVLVGASAFDLIHPDDRPVAERAFARAKGSGGRRMPRDWRLMHAEGHSVSAQLRVESHLDDPRIGGVAYTMRAAAARTPTDQVLAAQMRILEDIARGLPLEPILDRIVHLLDDFVDGHAVLFLHADADTTAKVLELRAAPTLPHALALRLAQPQPVEEGAAPWGRALTRGESVVDERLGGPGWEGWREELLTLGIRAAYAAPVRPDHGDRLGAMAVLARQPGPPSDEAAQVLKITAGLSRIAIERDLAAADLRRRATFDELTGLTNRAQLVDLLADTVADPSRSVSLVFIDLDRFTLVNDSYGHEVGDELLRSVGARLWAAAPPGSTVARFGGDEFVVLLDDLSGPHEAIAAANRFGMAMHAPFVLRGAELRATVSMGVAFARPGDASAATLLRDADAALARAKARGRDRVEVFDDVLRNEVHLRLQLEQDLRVGIDSQQLVVHYQPEIDLRSNEVVGVEALVRWQHPERGLLLPGEFIELAEETGLVIALGEQVLDHAAEHAQRWRRARPDGDRRAFTVWVNAAMRQLDVADPPRRLVDIIAALLDRHQLPPHMLGVEITERDLVRNLDDTVAQLEALADLGVRIAVDDFGTGYASLTYLKRLPLEVVKIDQSFVAGLGTDAHDEAIVGAVIQLARALGKEVVAEGVETEAQRDRLLALGCTVAQGYLMARPVAAEFIQLT